MKKDNLNFDPLILAKEIMTNKFFKAMQEFEDTFDEVDLVSINLYLSEHFKLKTKKKFSIKVNTKVGIISLDDIIYKKNTK